MNTFYRFRVPDPRSQFAGFILFMLFIASLGIVFTPAPAQGDLRQRFQTLRQATETKQDEGFDVSLPAEMLEDVRAFLRNGSPEFAEPLLDQIAQLLDNLTKPPENPAQAARVVIDASRTGDRIPHLAGNVVNKNTYDEPIFQRFMQEIGPGLIQMKLFLADLNEERDNYCFLQREGKWEETIRQIKAAGGDVLLHLRQVPARLTLVPEANQEFGQGKAPLSGPQAVAEWRTIVKEVISHFNDDPQTRIKYVQGIGEPNIGTNWYEPDNPLFSRPMNAEPFAEHFRNTAEAAKEADPDILVGGPTLWLGKNDQRWWDGFLGTMVQHEVSLDFLTIHIYDPNFGIWDYGVNTAREKMKQYGYDDLELNMTEWNIDGTLDAPRQLQESHFPASHAIAGFLRLLDQALQHTIFQLNAVGDANCFNPPPARAAGPQTNLLLDINGQIVPHPRYNAFRLFAMLREAERLSFNSDDGRILGIAGEKEDEIMTLLTFYEPLKINLDAFEYELPDWTTSRRLHLQLNDLPFEDYTVEVYRIDQEQSNFYTLGVEGAELELAATSQGQGKTFSTDIELPIYGVEMIRLIRSR